MRPDCKGAERVAVVGELVEPPAMEPKGGTLESRSTKNNSLRPHLLFTKHLPSIKFP